MRANFRLLSVGLILSFLLSAACGGIEEYESKEGRFSVLMPGSPELETLTVNDPVTGPRDVYLSMKETDAGAFFVAYFDVPQEYTDVVGSSIILDGVRDGALANVQGNLLTEEIISLDGHPGRSITASVQADGQDVIMRIKIYVVDTRVYQVYWAGPSDERYSSDVDNFLESFKLTGSIPVKVRQPSQAIQSTRPPAAQGFREFVDPAGNFSITIPDDWKEDLEFGKNLFQEYLGSAAAVKFYAGKPVPGGYEPHIFVLGSFVPRGTDREEYIDEVIRIETSGPDGIGTESVHRESVEFAGEIAEQVSYIDRPDALYPQGFETFVMYLLKGNRSWDIYCGASRNLVEEMSRCKETVLTFRLER